MEIGQSAIAAIVAREQWNDTGIQLIAGEQYHLQAVGEWVDWIVTCDADGYSSVNFVQRMSESLRRSPGDPWFALMGSLGGDPGRLFRIGKDSTYSPELTGTLFCFANDVSMAYWNNRGEVQLTVTRVG